MKSTLTLLIALLLAALAALPADTVEDSVFAFGLVGLVTSRWATSEFMNFSVTPKSPQGSAPDRDSAKR